MRECIATEKFKSFVEQFNYIFKFFIVGYFFLYHLQRKFCCDFPYSIFKYTSQKNYFECTYENRFEGQPVGKVDFGTRLLCIEKEIIGARNTYIQQGTYICNEK